MQMFINYCSVSPCSVHASASCLLTPPPPRQVTTPCQGTFIHKKLNYLENSAKTKSRKSEQLQLYKFWSNTFSGVNFCELLSFETRKHECSPKFIVFACIPLNEAVEKVLIKKTVIINRIGKYSARDIKTKMSRQTSCKQNQYESSVFWKIKPFRYMFLIQVYPAVMSSIRRFQRQANQPRYILYYVFPLFIRLWFKRRYKAQVYIFICQHKEW